MNMIKESIHQEDTIILNLYVLNNIATKCEMNKMTSLKGKIDKLQS